MARRRKNCNLYLTYIIDLLGRPEYSRMLEFLLQYEFKPILNDDRNRAADGIWFRVLYFQNAGIDMPEEAIRAAPCSVLEMMVALAVRMDYIAGDPGMDQTAKWFWMMIDNLDLTVATDENFNKDYIISCIDRWLCRLLEPNGVGGAFPLRNPMSDQRYTSIWTQMNEYILEGEYYETY